MNKSKSYKHSLMAACAGARRTACTIAMLLLGILAMHAFDYNGCTYAINSDGTTVTLTAGTATSGRTIIVPGYAYDGSESYAVTVIKGRAFPNKVTAGCNKVVIGDNVERIEEKAFEFFANNSDGNVLVLGRNVTVIEDQAFEHFSEHGNNNSIIVACDGVPTAKKAFEHAQNTTVYVKDEATYNKYKYEEGWSGFDGKKGNRYDRSSQTWDMNIAGGKWVTAMFPEDIDESTMKAYFGKDTKWARLRDRSYSISGNDYVFRLDFRVYTTKIPANTPILIKASQKESRYVGYTDFAEGEHSIKQSFEVNDWHDLYMIGANEAYTLQKGEYYIRSREGDKLTFYEAADDTSCHVGKGKCYFRLEETGTGKLVSAKLQFVIDGEATAIDGVETDAREAPTAIYSITGQYEGNDISTLKSGVHIVNGKKILVK